MLASFDSASGPVLPVALVSCCPLKMHNSKSKVKNIKVISDIV